RGTFLDALLDELLDLVPLAAIDDGTNGGALGAGITGLGLVRDAPGDGGDFLHLRQWHDHARRRVAGLAGIVEHVHDAAGDRLGQVGIVEDDVRRLAAEFLADALYGGGCALGHVDAGAGRAGERDHVDVGMLGHGGADFGAEAVDQVEHALRHAGLMQDFREDQCRGWRKFRGLEDHGAAGGKRWRDLAGDLVQGPVPRRDHADDADRFAQHDSGADRLLEMIVLEHVEGRSEMAEAGAGLQLLGHRQRRAHLVGDGGADVLHAGLVDLDDFRKQHHTLLAAGLRKSIEGTARRGDGLVDVGFGAERNLIHRLFSRRIDDGRGLLDDGIDPGAVDVELHAIDHRKPLYFRARMKRERKRSATILARKPGQLNPPYADACDAAGTGYKVGGARVTRWATSHRHLAVPHRRADG